MFLTENCGVRDSCSSIKETNLSGWLTAIPRKRRCPVNNYQKWLMFLALEGFEVFPSVEIACEEVILHVELLPQTLLTTKHLGWSMSTF